jgi:uncharacterized protein YqeY
MFRIKIKNKNKMPSKSEKQQKFFQIVKAYKDKKMSAAEVGKNVEDAAKDMSKSQIEKFTKLVKKIMN